MGDSSLPTRLRFEPIALYTVRQIAWATFLATPLAGGWLLRWNFLKLGNLRAARSAMVLSIAATVALYAIAFAVDVPSVRLVAALTTVWVTRAIAQAQQGEAIGRHIADGGAILSNWRVARIGAVAMAGVFALFAATSYASIAASEPDHVALGAVDIQYSGDATESDARRVGEFLTAQGYVSRSEGATVLLEGTSPDYTVSFVYGDDWDDDRLVAWVSRVAHRVSTNVLAGRLTTVHLLDTSLRIRNTIHAPFVAPRSPMVDAVVAAVEGGDAKQRAAALASLEKPLQLPVTEVDRLLHALVGGTYDESPEIAEFATNALTYVLQPARGFDQFLAFADANPADIGPGFSLIRGLDVPPQPAQIQALLALATNIDLTDEIAFTALTWVEQGWLSPADLAPHSDALIAGYRAVNASRLVGRSLGQREDGDLEWAHERCSIFLELFAYLPRHEVVVLLDDAAKDADPQLAFTAKASLRHPAGAAAPN